MENANDKADKLIKIVSGNETTHEQQSSSIKQKSLIETGVPLEIAKTLKKIKNGVLTKITLGISCGKKDDANEVHYDFRLLSSQEECDIDDEMEALGYKPLSLRYNLYYLSKVLSCATKSIPSLLSFEQPELSEAIIRNALPTSVLLALGNHYLEFKRKYSPSIERFTEAQINEVLEGLTAIDNASNEELALIKKSDSLLNLNFSQMLDIVISSHKRLATFTKLLDK